jgi:hypothetical protein
LDLFDEELLNGFVVVKVRQIDGVGAQLASLRRLFSLFWRQLETDYKITLVCEPRVQWSQRWTDCLTFSEFDFEVGIRSAFAVKVYTIDEESANTCGHS